MYKNRKIYVFADVPHLIKLLRNHFIDQGFLIDEKYVKKDRIWQAVEKLKKTWEKKKPTN